MVKAIIIKPSYRRSGCALRAIAEGRREARYASKSGVGSVKRGTRGAAKQSEAE